MPTYHRHPREQPDSALGNMNRMREFDKSF